MKYAYIGDNDQITLRQVTFPQGEAVDLSGNPDLAKKVSVLDYFEAVLDPAPVDPIDEEALAVEAEALGLKVDKRWSAETLRDKVEAARGQDNA